MKAALLLVLALALARSSKVYDLDALLAFDSSSEENGMCSAEVFNSETVDLVNNLMDEIKMMETKVRMGGMKFLTKKYMEIREAFVDGQCDNLMPETFTMENRDEPLYKFLENFVTPKGNKLTPEMVKMVQTIEQMVWYAVRNSPFTSCFITKFRDAIAEIISDCMGDKINFDTSLMKPFVLPQMGDDDFTKNVRGMLNMYIKSLLLASKCEKPMMVVKSMSQMYMNKFCKAARKSYGAENPECYKTFEKECPNAVGCMRDMVTEFKQKTKEKLMMALKSVKECKPENAPPSAPSVNNILKRMFKVIGQVQNSFTTMHRNRDPTMRKIKAEAKEHLRNLMDVFLNDSACECKAV